MALLVTFGPLIAPALAAEEPVIAKTHPKGNQPPLAVAFDSQGQLRAKTGALSAGPLEGGIVVEVPETLRDQRAKAKFEIVPVGEQRQAIVVTLPTELPTRLWQALVVATPGKSEPQVLFQGFTGYLEGEEGLRKGTVLEISEPFDDAGSRRIVLGAIQEELTLCGRRALLSPKMLSPKSLTLEPAKLQRLSADERERAIPLVAQPHAMAPTVAPPAPATPAATTPAQSTLGSPEAQSPPASPLGRSVSLLRAVGASSAIGWPASLTDGDPETTWSENRGGSGRGEFVTFRTPSDVPLQAFDFVVRPITRELAKGVGPEKLWLATQQQLYAIRFPSDPWKDPGVRWHVALPAPIQTDCVALVTESAYGEKPDSQLTLADVSAESEFANASVDELVGALAGGGTRAEAAATILSAMGEPARKAVAQAFDSLDEGGRRVALVVFDHADCSVSSPVYIKALLGSTEAHRLHAIDRLRRCGSNAVEPIERALGDKPKLAQRPLLELLSEVAPDRAVSYIVPRLFGGAKLRRQLREVLALAARSLKAQDNLRAELARTELPQAAFIDALRALGPKVIGYSELVAPRLAALLATETDWRARYLLLAPAHELVTTNPKMAETLSSVIRSDPSAYVRAEAIRSVRHGERFKTDLVLATTDPEVRVRQAATELLSNQRDPQSLDALTTRLAEDAWPLVRAQAAESLSLLPANSNVDQRLGAALGDEAWTVRIAVAEALGKRHATTAAENLLEHFDDRSERFEVRVAAAHSLGTICYERALDSLTDQARKLAKPGMDLRDRAVAASALNALGSIHPNDLGKRLAPLVEGKDVPGEVRAAAKAALDGTSQCRKNVKGAASTKTSMDRSDRWSFTHDL